MTSSRCGRSCRRCWLRLKAEKGEGLIAMIVRGKGVRSDIRDVFHIVSSFLLSVLWRGLEGFGWWCLSCGLVGVSSSESRVIER